MIDEFETEEPDEINAGRRSGFQVRSWRPQIGRRLLDRVRLIATWLIVTVLPRYGWRSLGSMLLITAGRLTDAASFIVGIHILTRSISGEDQLFNGFQGGVTFAAIGMAGILIIGSLLSYFGAKIAAQVAIDYENASLAQGVAIIASQQSLPNRLSAQDASNIMRQAPRMMARSLWNIIHACTSLFMMISGFITCMIVFPELMGLVILALIILSPVYIYAAVHSTNIGHHMRAATPGYGAAISRIQKKWVNQDSLDNEALMEDIISDREYTDYQNAYKARLTLSSRNHLLSNLTMAIVVALSFIWIANRVELSTGSIALVVSYLVGLRLFAHGFGGIFHGIQMINAFLPFFLSFLTHDPRLKKASQEE